MDKLGIFPIAYDLLILLKYKELLQEEEIHAISSFKEDVYLKDLENEFGEITVTADIEKFLKGVDTILLLDNENEFSLTKYKRIYSDALVQQKKILVSTKLYSELRQEKKSNVQFLEKKGVEETELKVHELYDNPLPVIAVCGMGKHCSKFETMLLTLKVLKASKYQALVIGSNPLLPLVGGYVLPQYLYSEHISLENKIYKLSADLYQLQKEENADVILIEMPGGIMPVGTWDYNHFSEIPMVISSALKIDVGILNTYVPVQQGEVKFQLLKEFCDCKYGVPLEAMCMARQRVEYDPYIRKCNYLNLDDETYNNLYERYCETDMVSLNNLEVAEDRIRQVVSLLEENAEFI